MIALRSGVLREGLRAVAGGVRAHLANLRIQLAGAGDVFGDPPPRLKQHRRVVASTRIIERARPIVKAVGATGISDNPTAILVQASRGYASSRLSRRTLLIALLDGLTPCYCRRYVDRFAGRVGRGRGTAAATDEQ